MAGYKKFYGKGAEVRYFPDQKTIVLIPRDKAQFLKLKTKLDTLLQIDGTKRTGNSFTLKLNDTFNVNIDEVLRSIGLKGGIEVEDASSMVDDATKESSEEKNNLQAPELGQPPPTPPGTQAPPQPGQPGQEIPAIPEGLFLKVSDVFLEDFYTPQDKKERRKSKRTGEYWKPIEAFIGKNRGSINPQDILEVRKKFSLKPPSEDRDMMLVSLDRAASYFFGRLEKMEGLASAKAFDDKYTSIDNLAPDDYAVEDEPESLPFKPSDTMSLTPDFDEVDYSNINIEQ